MDAQQISELKSLQMILLSMMKVIDKLCKKNNITYYLSGGNALGAIRHDGFIPWDDDFDIMMTTGNYKKFLSVCRQELDPRIWYVQEAWNDWPGCFSKIRLRNTYLDDVGEWEGIPIENRGIFIDVFEIVDAPSFSLLKLTQYYGAKMLNAYSLMKKGYKTSSLPKKLAMSVSRLMNNKTIFNLVKRLVYRYNEKDTKEYGNFFGSSRYNNAFYRKGVFALPYYHLFEDVNLPLPTEYDVYLTQAFGNYMVLPPADKQKPAHAIKVDFGPYKDRSKLNEQEK